MTTHAAQRPHAWHLGFGPFDFERRALVRIVLLVLGVLTTGVGCTRPQTLVIAPATMSTTASQHNHPEAGAFVLIENASLSARLKFRSVHRWELRITARAVPAADGTWPQLRVDLDGEPSLRLVIGDRRPLPYHLDFVAEPGLTDVALSLLNGAPVGSGPILVIEQVEIVPS